MGERITDEELDRVVRNLDDWELFGSIEIGHVASALVELQERRRVEREALGPVVRLPEDREDRAVPS